MTRCGSGREDGSASVYVLALACVLGLVTVVLVSLGEVAVTRHRAAASADLAALAAAARALHGAGPACAVARDVAQAQGAELVSCRLMGEVSEVVVEVRPAGHLGRIGSARGQAWAGPASAPLP